MKKYTLTKYIYPLFRLTIKELSLLTDTIDKFLCDNQLTKFVQHTIFCNEIKSKGEGADDD